MSEPTRCVTIEGTHCTVWLNVDGERVAYRCVGGPVIDERAPPFYQIFPCPYCGVAEDRGHDPLKHVDPRLGQNSTQGVTNDR